MHKRLFEDEMFPTNLSYGFVKDTHAGKCLDAESKLNPQLPNKFEELNFKMEKFQAVPMHGMFFGVMKALISMTG